ncbi:hypothetical protein JHK87_000494 [Glycine soja]|nr:hypothetical protein JHK87_000494 [Glycine soja]
MTEVMTMVVVEAKKVRCDGNSDDNGGDSGGSDGCGDGDNNDEVCDLYCGDADADKWIDTQIGHYIGIDASSSGIEQMREAWEIHRKSYTVEFFELDPCTVSKQTSSSILSSIGAHYRARWQRSCHCWLRSG